jgi:hypothetical protein
MQLAQANFPKAKMSAMSAYLKIMRGVPWSL